MSPEDLTEVIGAEVMNTVMSNPMMRLASISQAAANLATVAKVCHDVARYMDQIAVDRQHDTDPKLLDGLNTKAVALLRTRDTCLNHIEALLAQVKNG